VVITHAGFFTFSDRRILFVAIDTLQLFCVPAFLMLSAFFLTNKLENQNNPALAVKKKLSKIIPPYLFWSRALYILNNLGELQKFDLLSLLRDILTGKGEVSLLLHRCDCSMLGLVVASREIKIFRTQKTFGFGLNNSNNFYKILLLKRSQIHIAFLSNMRCSRGHRA
jgi:fucose 4-O-acetylase-like acetyltransferase